MDFYIFFVIGAFIGSFFNVVIYRLPREESVVKPRSHCPKCKVPIPFYRNIPIISYIIQLGKCANCKNNISTQWLSDPDSTEIKNEFLDNAECIDSKIYRFFQI